MAQNRIFINSAFLVDGDCYFISDPISSGLMGGKIGVYCQDIYDVNADLEILWESDKKDLATDIISLHQFGLYASVLMFYVTEGSYEDNSAKSTN